MVIHIEYGGSEAVGSAHTDLSEIARENIEGGLKSNNVFSTTPHNVGTGSHQKKNQQDWMMG